jgi:hypothetical protein
MRSLCGDGSTEDDVVAVAVIALQPFGPRAPGAMLGCGIQHGMA